MGDVNIQKSFSERNYKFFIGYLYNGNKVKPSSIMHLKKSAYVKSYDKQTIWVHFLIEDDDLKDKEWQ